MNRRNALRAGATLFGVPWQKIMGATATPLPDDALFARDPETYWTHMREEQFFLPQWRSFLNNGSLGVLPRPVYQTVATYMENAAALETPYPYPRWGYETLDEEREELSKYLGCKKDELALMHNATEALSTVAAGLDLKAGDEVVMTNQEHPSGKAGWAQKQARFGISVREVTIPLPPKDPGQLADLMISAIGPKTRVLSFSGITSPTGLIMPIKDICDAARTKGVMTLVDGAHMHGQMALKISDLHCDFFAGSPHKWAIFEGMIAGLRFAQAVGPERIYACTHQLARRTYERAAKLPYIKTLTPNDDRMFAALVGIQFTKDAGAVWQETAKRKIFVSGGPRVRLSSHIHTRPSDIDQLFDIIEEKMGKA